MVPLPPVTSARFPTKARFTIVLLLLFFSLSTTKRQHQHSKPADESICALALSVYRLSPIVRVVPEGADERSWKATYIVREIYSVDSLRTHNVRHLAFYVARSVQKVFNLLHKADNNGWLAAVDTEETEELLYIMTRRRLCLSFVLFVAGTPSAGPLAAQAFTVSRSKKALHSSTRRSPTTCSSGQRASAAVNTAVFAFTRDSAATSDVESTNQQDDVASLSRRIEDCVARGQEDPEPWLCRLEELNSSREPNRDQGFLGDWHVWYTDAPPPSNGRLGPFQGTAAQHIDDAMTRSYQNLLAVPPNDWLTATLDGRWEEWDGVYLDGDEEYAAAVDKNMDWGAAHWKVTFLRLRISLFKKFDVVNKEFPPNTSRVWRTTYLDDGIRIVRAGKTGRVEDEMVFYTKRTPPPKS